MKKKTLIISLIIFFVLAILAFPLTKEFQNKEANIPATVVAHNFSPEGEKIKLGFVSASATKETLTLVLSITGIDLNSSPYAFRELVCFPYINTEEVVKKTFVSYSGDGGDPNQITYVYELSGNTYQTLHAEVDWTIGPCGNTDAMESNVTPSAAKLMTNYHFSFVVPVK